MKFLSLGRNDGDENSPLICLINGGLFFILKNINIRMDHSPSIPSSLSLFSPSYIFFIHFSPLLSSFEVSLQAYYSPNWKSASFQIVFNLE